MNAEWFARNSFRSICVCCKTTTLIDSFFHVWDFATNTVLTPQGQLSLRGTFGVWTDVQVLWTKADEGEAGM